MSSIDQEGRRELQRGWRLLVACAVGVGFSAIALPFYSIGPLTKPVEAAMGWARADIQLAIIFSSGIGALTAPITGWMIDRFGPRAVALPSIVGVSLGLFIAARATSLSGFYLGYALAAILGAGTNPVLWSRVVAGQFVKARGFALGLALVGTALVSIAMPYIVTLLHNRLGWRHALDGLAMLPLLVSLPIVFFWLRPREHTAVSYSVNGSGSSLQGLTLRQALSGYRFWVLGLSILAGYLAISGVLSNLVPALSDRGFDPVKAATIAGTVGFAMIPGRVLVGYLVDRFWAPGVAFAVVAMPAMSCLLFVNTDSEPLLFLACALLGLAAGAELDLLAFMAARYFGLAHYSKIYALLYACLAVGSATAPFFFASVHDASGSYDVAFLVSGGLFAVGGLLFLVLGRYPDLGGR